MGPVTAVKGSYSQNYAQNDSFQVAARLGYAFRTGVSQVMPYLKAGFENARFTNTVRNNTAKFLNAVTLDWGNATLKKRYTAPFIGVGGDIKLTENIIIGLSFSYACYKKTEQKSINSTISNAQAVAMAAAAGGGIPPAALPVAGDTISKTVKNTIRFSRSIQLRVVYTF